jgi:hypothetical protein
LVIFFRVIELMYLVELLSRLHLFPTPLLALRPNKLAWRLKI